VESISTARVSPDDFYKTAVEQFGPSLERLVSAYEVDPEKRRDLSQDIHFQLWRVSITTAAAAVHCGRGRIAWLTM
jgi:hypothetical protein